VFAEPNWNDLIHEHHEELAVHKDTMPLDPDYDRCLKLEEAGLFRAWIGRAENGELGAYIAWFIQPHLHYRTTMHAVEDLFMLSSPYRRGDNGARMFDECFPELKKLGVRRIICHSKTAFEKEHPGFRRFFEKRGFEHTDNLWSGWL
jgi:GNAT superfamily N-acetyltransferase